MAFFEILPQNTPFCGRGHSLQGVFAFIFRGRAKMKETTGREKHFLGKRYA